MQDKEPVCEEQGACQSIDARTRRFPGPPTKPLAPSTRALEVLPGFRRASDSKPQVNPALVGLDTAPMTL